MHVAAAFRAHEVQEDLVMQAPRVLDEAFLEELRYFARRGGTHEHGEESLAGAAGR
jgi:hypothetical protein